MLTAMAVNAASYNIWVKGIQVTDANKNNVLGDGKVTYLSSDNRLELNGANITAPTSGSSKEAKMALCIKQDITVVIRKTVTLTGNGDNPAMALWGGHNVTFSTLVGEDCSCTVKIVEDEIAHVVVIPLGNDKHEFIVF